MRSFGPLISIALIDATAEALLNIYAKTDRLMWLGLSIILYSVGCWIYVYLLKAHGFGVSVAMSTAALLALNMIVAIGLFGERYSATQWLGLVTVFAGIALLMSASDQSRA